MKKFKMLLASLALVSTGLLLIQKFNSPKKQNTGFPIQNTTSEIAKPVQAVDSKSSETIAQAQKRGYKIQEYNGNIAVFEKGQKQPFRKTEIAVKNLPEADQNELKNGIEVETSEELQVLLEDYLS